MTSATLDWIDAETPHAKVLRSNKTSDLSLIEKDLDVQAAVERIEKFQARLLRETQERPLVLVESA
jgi:hypothetical protein